MFTAERAEEWAEFVADCGKFDAEIDKEIRVGKLTMAELEEEDQSLERLRRWYRDIKARDVFGAPAAVEAEQQLKHCADRLADYTEQVSKPCTRCDPIEHQQGPASMDPDTQLFLDINGFARTTPWLHGIVSAYAAYGIVVFAALMLAAWWAARRHASTAMTAAVWAPLGMFAALGVNQPIAALVGEPRPYTALPHLLVLVHYSQDPSFPSDHAVMAGAVAAGVFLAHRRLGLLAGLAAVVMAFSRVYIAVPRRSWDLNLSWPRVGVIGGQC